MKFLRSSFLVLIVAAFFLQIFYPSLVFIWAGFFSLGFIGVVMSFPYRAMERDEEAIKERDAILEVLLEGVISFDAKGDVMYANTTASQMFGIPRADFIKKPLHGNAAFVEKALFLMETSKKIGTPLTDSMTVEIEKKRYLDLVSVPRKGGGFLILQDVSSQQKVLEMGKDFVANASHELKTPITIIRGFAETLQDMKDLPREIVEDILEKIVRNCQRMNSLVRNLLTLADIENIPLLNCRTCDLIEILEESRRAVLSMSSTAQVEIIKETECVAEVEGSILELAILNLLDNAVKYSREPAKITVHVKQSKDKAIISISDEGMGIPSQDIDHIFERFYTVNKAHSRKLGGAGLGLALVKKIIDKHEGTLKVSSVLDKGTTFVLTLPRFRKG